MNTTHPVEVRRSAWAIWSPFTFAVASAGLAVQRVLMPGPLGSSDLLPILLTAVAAGFFAAFLFTLAERLILHADRIERVGLLRRVVRKRAEVTGYRAVEGQALIFGPPGGWRMAIPGHVFKNEAWREWIETCRNLDAVEITEALAAAERDPSLGHDVTGRRQTLAIRRWATLALTAGMTGLFLWTIIWPQPSGLPVYLSSAAPFLALALVVLKRDVFAILSDSRVSTRIDLSMIIFGATGPAIVAFNLPLVDWLQPLLVAASVGVLAAILTLRLAMDAAQRHWLVGVVMGVGVLASSWGGLLALNQALDDRPPMLAAVTVLGSHGEKGKPQLNVDVHGPRPFRMNDLRVSRATFQAFKSGAPLCAGVYPGRFGWRSIRLVKCEAVVQLPQSPRP